MKSSNVVTLSCSSAAPVIAWMEIGTSCMLSTRRCAVTVISWIESEFVSASVVAAAARPRLGAAPLRMAAMA